MKTEQKKQLTLQEVSEVYGMPIWTLRASISKRLIPHRRIGRRIYIDRNRFEEWLTERDIEVVNDMADNNIN